VSGTRALRKRGGVGVVVANPKVVVDEVVVEDVADGAALTVLEEVTVLLDTDVS
jgi:hypothetical protein